MNEKNPFNITTPEGMPTRKAVDLFVDVLSDFPKVKREGHLFLHGARGTGKSMIFRFLRPDCQSVAYRRILSALDFFSVYVPIKLTDLKLGELMGVEGTRSDVLLNEHYLCMFITTRLLKELEELIGYKEFYPWQETEAENVKAMKHFVVHRFNPLLVEAGEPPVKESRIKMAKTTRDYCHIMRDKLQQMRSAFTRFLRYLAFKEDIPVYSGGMCGYLDFLLPLLSYLSELPFMPSAPIYLLLDDADNLNLIQTKILNSWVASRTTENVSIKVSTQLHYKTYHTTEGALIDAPHDYSEINISTIYTNRGDYIKRVEQIIDRRFKLFGLENCSVRDFFPADKQQEAAIKKLAEEPEKKSQNARSEYIKRLAKKSSYNYAGFEQLAHVSSGIIRNYLEPASTMFSDMVASGNKSITCIPVSTQNRIIRKMSSDFFFDTFEKLLADDSAQAPVQKQLIALRNLICFLGGLFHLHLISEKSERRLFSFAISDEPSQQLVSTIRLGVQLGFFHRSSIGNKDGTGRTIQYIMSRLLAPHFNLDPSGFYGYKFLTSDALESAMIAPEKMLRSIKKRGFDILESNQLELQMYDTGPNVEQSKDE